MQWISLLLAAQTCVVRLEATLAPSLPGGDSLFGSSVDMDQDRLVVGAPQSPAFGGGHRGVVYIYDRVASTWTETAILADSKGTPNNQAQFGYAVSVSGPRVAVGAPESNNPNLTLFIYRLTGNVWIEEQIIQPPQPPPYYQFGHAVDLDGDTLALGAPWGFHTLLNPKPAHAFVYTWGVNGWTMQAHLRRDETGDVTGEQAFGWSVALSGDDLFVGSPLAAGSTALSGAVYAYKRTGSVWSLRQKLFAKDGKPWHRFGWSLAAQPGVLAVGAPTADAPTKNGSGATYLFEQIGGTWVEQHKFLSPGYMQGMCLPPGICFGPEAGISVALSSEHLVFGELEYAHLLRRSGGSWVDELQFRDGPFNIGQNTHYGLALAMHQKSLAVGAMAKSNPNPRVYVYDIQSTNVQPRFYCTPKTVGHCIPRIFDVGQPSISGASAGKPYSIWADELRPEVEAMLFYGLGGPATTPFLGGTLCISPPLARALLVDTSGNTILPCSGHPATDFNAYIQSGKDPALVAGQQIWFQWWYREPSFPVPNNVGLSPGLSAIICQ
jgi:hypothetical protein